MKLAPEQKLHFRSTMTLRKSQVTNLLRLFAALPVQLDLQDLDGVALLLGGLHHQLKIFELSLEHEK